VLAESELSFVGYAPIPLRHGMTMGELARYFNADVTIELTSFSNEVDAESFAFEADPGL